MAKKGYCPSCEAERELKRVRAREKVKVRGDTIEVDVLYWHCLTCREEFEAPGDTHDEVAEAYRLYRAKKGLMQPDEIKALREDYGLTQSELAQILGFGAVTLSRYETGMLQSAAHDRMLQMVREPRIFWAILNRLGDQVSLSPATIDRVRDKLRKTISAGELFDPVLEAALDYEPDGLSGYQRFNRQKFANVIFYFCQTWQWKTKINKFLFYADFKHFRDHSRSITGSRYAHAPYGPCPDKFEHIFTWLTDRGDVQIVEVPWNNYMGEQIHAQVKPNLTVFTRSELQVLTEVKDRLSKRTAKYLSELSHKERGYSDTESGQLISYKYAKDLRI